MVLTLTSGCIRSKLNITSEPSGATVRMERENHGRTPASVPFIWYWYYEIELQKEGYETLKVRERLYAPPYFWIPFDLFFELLPFDVHDTRHRHYFLEPVKDV